MAQSAAKYDLIIEAARALFPKHGITETSMADIAARAGVAKQTLYSRFVDKEALFPEVLTRVRAERGPQAPETPREGAGKALVLTDPDLLVALAGLGNYVVELITDPELAALRRITLVEGANPSWMRLWAADGPDPLRAALIHDFDHRPEIAVPDPELAADQFLALVTHRATLDTLANTPRPADPAAHYGVVAACVTFLRAFAAPRPDATPPMPAFLNVE